MRTVDALRSYEKCCTGTLLLDAVESERQLRVRLSSLEPLYKSLQAKHSENERYIDELEKLAEGATVESKDHNAQLRGLRGENAVLKGKIDSLEVCASSRSYLTLPDCENRTNFGNFTKAHIPQLPNYRASTTKL